MGAALATKRRKPEGKKVQWQVKRENRWLNIEDWREARSDEIVRIKVGESWRNSDKKIKLNEQAGALVPTEMKEALRAFKAGTQLPMSTFIRDVLGKALKRRTKKDKLKEALELVEQVIPFWVDRRLRMVRGMLLTLIADMA